MFCLTLSFLYEFEVTNLKHRLILRFLKGNLRYLLLSLVFLGMVTVCNAGIPQIIRYAVDHAVSAGEAQRSLLLWCVGAVVTVAAASAFCNFIGKTLLAVGSEGYLKSLRDRLYEHISGLPYAWFSEHPTGDIIQRCINDVDTIRRFVCTQMIEVIRTIVQIVFFMAVMFTMDLRVALVEIAFIPVIILYSVIYYGKIGSRFLAADEAEGELSAAVQENLTGVRVVRAFGREQYEISRFDEKNNHFAQMWVRLGRIMSAYWASGDLITGVQTLLVMTAGIYACAGGRISLGTFIALMSYNASLVWPVRSLGRQLSEMSKAGVSMDRVEEILGAQTEENTGKRLRPPMDGDIVFEHVNYAYPGSLKPTLQDIDFRIKGGSTFGILGSTGSGKSTLMHLLDRLYELPEESGRITIGGTDIRDIDLHYLRSKIGLILQEPFLYSRTIGENISISCREPVPEEVRRVSRIACLDESISEFADQYDTIVGERGVTLSGGQKQRVAIAQTLMKHAPILVFDDSLSAVDTETDSRIRAALAQNTGSATVILISHRITTLRHADCIAVMDDGKVKDLGTHEELIARAGSYRDVYKIQMEAMAAEEFRAGKSEAEESQAEKSELGEVSADAGA